MDDHLVSMLYPILGRAIIDRDRFEVLGAPPGPAGVSAVDLPDGEVWEVDHLEPGIPVRFEVDAEGADRSPLLVAVFGGDGALYLADEATEWSPDLEYLIDPHEGRPLRRDYGSHGNVSRSGDLANMAGQVVVLSDLGSDVTLGPLARIAAVAEMVPRAYGVSGGELLLPRFPEFIALANSLVGEIDNEELTLLDGGLALRLADAVSRLLQTGRVGHSPLSELVAELLELGQFDNARISALTLNRSDRGRSEMDDHMFGDGLAEDAMVTDHMAAAPRLAAPPSSDQADSDEQYLEIQRPHPSLLRVRVARGVNERWVRVRGTRGLVTLALAPLRRQDLVELAELAIPPDIEDEDIHVEVVDVDDLGGSDGGPIQMIQSAIEAGRDAARVTRVHGPSRAVSRWIRCADLWEGVGDYERARIARSIADGGFIPQISPYLADEVVESLESTY